MSLNLDWSDLLEDCGVKVSNNRRNCRIRFFLKFTQNFFKSNSKKDSWKLIIQKLKIFRWKFQLLVNSRLWSIYMGFFFENRRLRFGLLKNLYIRMFLRMTFIVIKWCKWINFSQNNLHFSFESYVGRLGRFLPWTNPLTPMKLLRNG